MAWFAAALLVGCLAPSLSLAGPDAGASAAQLRKLRSSIKALRDSLDKDRAKQSTLSRQLHTTEVRIAKLTGSLHDLSTALAQHRSRLQQLRKRRADEQKALDHLRAGLARQVRAAYAMGRQEELKLILNQRDPATISRMLVYYRYIARARAKRIGEVRHHLQRLAEVRQSINKETVQLTRLRDQRGDERDRLQKERASRAAVLAHLKARIESKSDRLTHMTRNERRLQDLVRKLQKALADIPAQAGKQRPFRDLRGRLPWPVAGHLLARYGAPREGSNLRWRGVFIASPPGQEVRAVARGRVAFADWLRGFGLLMIIDHGDGYMSLYGHNQALLKQVGDWVEAGEPVALTGDSGGVSHSGVYFELRSHGHTINPMRWCHGRPPRVATAH
ncbi:MAG: peptidoglycan DD-metalloendopeptidase family protein [Gammaproteobacteria bacterium]